jgi:glucans biosynthesis protein C
LSSPAAAPQKLALEPKPEREYGLDWLRVFAFCVLIFYHSGMAFVTWDWHLKNPEQSTALESVMLACNRWRLPLLFLISGAGVCFSLRRRSMGEFAAERIRRLLLPLVVGMFVVVPPQVYLERIHNGAQLNYPEFYATVLQFEAYPKGNFSWHHLWFVAYILVYSLIGIPIFRMLGSPVGQRAVSSMVDAFRRWPLLIYAVNVPNLLVAIYLGPHWPTTHNLVADWANFTGAFLTFLWGFTIASNKGFLDLITRRRKEFLAGGIAVAVLFFAARGTGLTREWPPGARQWFWESVNGYYGMTWIFAMIGYARAYITRPSAWLGYATEAVYPFYIFHQTITVALVYLVIPWNAGIRPKMTVVALGTFAGSWLLFEAVRRVRWLRPLFGLKVARS